MLVNFWSILLICIGFVLLWAVMLFFLIKRLLTKVNEKVAVQPVQETTKKINAQVYSIPIENVLAVLNDVVQQQLKYHLEMNIKQFGPAYINDKTFEKTMQAIIDDIYLVLSDDYKELLHQYFSQDGLTLYIYKTIHPVVLQISLEKNEIK